MDKKKPGYFNYKLPGNPVGTGTQRGYGPFF